MSQQYNLFGRHSPFSTPPLSDASGSAPSSPSEHELPVIISVRRPRLAKMSGQSAKQAAAGMTEGSSHKGRHLRRGEQLKRNAACAQCRRRRTKCDAAKPHCSACVRHHAYLRKTQPDSYPDDSCVICSYEEETDRPVSLRGLGTDTPIVPASAPNGRRKSMPVLSRAARRTSKQSSRTPSDSQGEPVMNELISRVAELQAQLVRQSSSTSVSSQAASAPLPFSEPTRTMSLPTPYSSPFLPGFNPLSIYMEGLSHTSDTIPPLAVHNDNSPFLSPSSFNGLNGNGNTGINVNPTISPLPFSGPMLLQSTYELFDTSSWDASAVSTQDVSRGSIDQLSNMNYMFSQPTNTTMGGAFSNDPPPIDIPRPQGLTFDNVYGMTQPFLPAPALDDGIQDPSNAMMETWSQAYLESEISRNMLSRHSI